MKRGRQIPLLFAVASLGACSFFGPLPLVDDPAIDDAGLEAFVTDVNISDVNVAEAEASMPPPPPAVCDPESPFRPPTPLGAINSSAQDLYAFLTDDERTMYFASERNGGQLDLFVATRSDRFSSFGPPAPVSELNSTVNEGTPWLSADRRTFIFSRDDRSTPPKGGVFIASRDAATGPFGPAAPITSVNAEKFDIYPFLSADGNDLWLASWRNTPERFDLFRSKHVGGTFATPEPVDELNVPTANDIAPVLTADSRRIYFASDRVGGKGLGDIWTSTRDDQGRFRPPTLVETVNTDGNEAPSWLSPDNCRLYLFHTPRPTGTTHDILVAERQPE